MTSKVYWADLRADFRENLQQKLYRLMKTSGMGEIDFENKFVAIKMHFGEPGNLAFLRPNWAKTVADFVKERGGKPFLTDCNTLYVGGRKNGLDHLDTACLNGFNPMTTGCQVIIADGLKGNDEVELPVAGGEYVKKAKIGRAIMDADVYFPDPFQGARVRRLWRRHQEHRHGLRQPRRQNGAAQRRKAPCGAGALRGLQGVHQDLRPQRHNRGEQKGIH